MLFLFRCDGEPFYALSGSRFVKRRLRSDVRPGNWRLHRTIEPADLGQHYSEAIQLLAVNGLCILDLSGSEPTLVPACGVR